MSALRQIDRQRQPDRTRSDNHDRMARRIRGRPILVRMAAITELGDEWLRHVSNPVLIGFLKEALVWLQVGFAPRRVSGKLAEPNRAIVMISSIFLNPEPAMECSAK